MYPSPFPSSEHVTVADMYPKVAWMFLWLNMFHSILTMAKHRIAQCQSRSKRKPYALEACQTAEFFLKLRQPQAYILAPPYESLNDPVRAADAGADGVMPHASTVETTFQRRPPFPHPALPPQRRCYRQPPEAHLIRYKNPS